MGPGKRENGKSFETHTSYYRSAATLCQVLVIENVPEYGRQVIQDQLGPMWSIKTMVIDPRIFGVCVARSRQYAICWKSEEVTWRQDVSLEKIIELLTSTAEATAISCFWQDLPKSSLTDAQALWLLSTVILGPSVSPLFFTRFGQFVAVSHVYHLFDILILIGTVTGCHDITLVQFSHDPASSGKGSSRLPHHDQAEDL